MKKTRKKFRFIVEKTRTGFSGYSEEIPVFTTGTNFANLNSNIIEAINFYFEEDKIIVSPENIILDFDLK